MRVIGRRGALTGLFALGGAGVLTWGGSMAACAGPAGARGLLMPLLEGLTDLPDPLVVARAWKSAEGAAEAASALIEDPDLMALALLPDAAGRRAALARHIRAEFERGDVVYAANWLVSRTEARIAAAVL